MESREISGNLGDTSELAEGHGNFIFRYLCRQAIGDRADVAKVTKWDDSGETVQPESNT